MNLLRGAWVRLFGKGGSKSEEGVVMVTGVATRRVEGTSGPERSCSKGKIKNFWFLEPGDRMGARRANGFVDAVIEKPFSFSGADEVIARRHSFFV